MSRIKIFESKLKATEALTVNKPFLVSINGVKICIVKSQLGLSAFKNNCPHAGASLSDGHINSSNEIVCPLHGYRFSLLDGREKSGNSCELYMYGLELTDEGLFLNIRKRA